MSFLEHFQTEIGECVRELADTGGMRAGIVSAIDALRGDETPLTVGTVNDAAALGYAGRKTYGDLCAWLYRRYGLGNCAVCGRSYTFGCGHTPTQERAARRHYETQKHRSGRCACR